MVPFGRAPFTVPLVKTLFRVPSGRALFTVPIPPPYPVPKPEWDREKATDQFIRHLVRPETERGVLNGREKENKIINV